MSDTTPAPVVEEPAPVLETPPTDPTPTPEVEPETPTPSPWDDPAVAKAEIERLRRENAAERVNAKAASRIDAREELLRELGLLKDDEPVDPAALKQELDGTRDELKQSRLELAVRRAAGTKYNADQILDSKSLDAALKALDPTDIDGITALLDAAVKTDPRLKASQAAAVGGADIAGGSGITRTYTRSQIGDPAFFQANKTDILAANAEPGHPRIRD